MQFLGGSVGGRQRGVESHGVGVMGEIPEFPEHEFYSNPMEFGTAEEDQQLRKITENHENLSDQEREVC